MTELTDKTAVSEPPMFEEAFDDEDNALEAAFDRAFLAMATPAPPSMPALPPIPAPPPVELPTSAFDDILQGEILVSDKPRVAAGSKPRVDPKMWGDAPSRAAAPKRPLSPSNSRPTTNRAAPRKSGPYQSLWRADATLSRDDASIRSSVYKSVAPAAEAEAPIWTPEPIVPPESAPSVIVAEASEPVREELAPEASAPAPVVMAEASAPAVRPSPVVYAPLHLDPLPPDVELSRLEGAPSDPLESLQTLAPTPLTSILPSEASASWPAERPIGFAPPDKIEVEPTSSASASWPAEQTSLAPARTSNAPIALAPELAEASAQPAMSSEDESWWQSELAAARTDEPSLEAPSLESPVAIASAHEVPPSAGANHAELAALSSAAWQAEPGDPANAAASSWQPEPLEPPPSASQLQAVLWANEAPSADARSSSNDLMSPVASDSASWTTPVELASPSDLGPNELPSEVHGEIDAFNAPLADVAPDYPAHDQPASFAAQDLPSNFAMHELPAQDFVGHEPVEGDFTAAQMREEIEAPFSEPPLAEPPLPEPSFAPPALAIVPAPAEEPAAEAAPAKIGDVITVFGCRGGCGATTIAVNLAGSLAAAGKEVCIVDLDVQLGDVLVTLDLDSTNAASLVNLAREVHNLDPDMLKRRLVRHDSGVYVLAQGGRLEEIDDTLPSKIPMLIAALARAFDAIIIDGVDDFSELALSAIDAANVIALVVTQEVISVRRGRRVIDICRQLEVPNYKIRPVINCYRKRAKVDRDSVSLGLGVQVAATVVEDERTTKRSQTAGQLLHEMARRKGVTKDIAALQALASSAVRPQPVPTADEPVAEDAQADAKS
jgi:MinD-like ATPase involved in chromosome partitioning or flagellar assembly